MPPPLLDEPPSNSAAAGDAAAIAATVVIAAADAAVVVVLPLVSWRGFCSNIEGMKQQEPVAVDGVVGVIDGATTSSLAPKKYVTYLIYTSRISHTIISLNKTLHNNSQSIYF